MSRIIEGKAIAADIRADIKRMASEMKNQVGITPKLSVVLVGDDPASEVYVKNKERGCEEVGIASDIHKLPANSREEIVLKLIESLNADKAVHGILVQLPLPKGISESKVLSHVAPSKDIDGLHPENMGKLFKGEVPLFMPCTPSGIMELILSTGISLKGKEAVVVGRSNIVGKPVALLMLSAHATVTICHSRTANLAEVVSRGDVVVAAVGKPKLVTGDMIKPGAVVIDVGINRTETGIVGDVDFLSAKDRASYITPVPGGVGPMTIAMLLKNTLTSAARFAEYRLS